AAAAQATGTHGPPRVIQWFRAARTTSSQPPRTSDRVDAVPSSAEPARAAMPRPTAMDPNASDLARVCNALGGVHDAIDARPLLDEVSRVLGAAGLLVWRWEPNRSLLQASIGHGYSDAVIAQLPNVTAGDDNAVAAAFRDADVRVVNGRNGLTGAVTVPI